MNVSKHQVVWRFHSMTGETGVTRSDPQSMDDCTRLCLEMEALGYDVWIEKSIVTPRKKMSLKGRRALQGTLYHEAWGVHDPGANSGRK